MNTKSILQAEQRILTANYRHELEALGRRVEDALVRLDRTNQSPISDHDTHNMNSNIHALSVMAGRFALVEAMLRDLK